MKAWWLIIGMTGLLGGCADLESRPPAGAAPEAAFALTDVTTEAGLGAFRHETGAYGAKWMPETLGAGGGFLDYDGDGWLDVLLVGGGTWPEQGGAAPVDALRLYRNNTDGTFTEQTEAAGLAGLRAYGFGVTTADYDNDGDTDVYLTTLRRNHLLRNDGGRFTDVAGEAGVAGPPAWSTCALFFDADRDGHLDLYVCGYVVWPPAREVACYLNEQKAYCPPEDYTGLPGRYYHNDGDGTFTERTEAAGFLPFPGKSLGVVSADLSRDGWPDLVVANDSERNLFYENDGDGTFTEKAVRSGIAYDENGHPRGGMGIDAGDVENGGRTTVFIGNFSEQMIGVFRQAGAALFVDRAAVSRIGHPSLLTLTFGLFLIDLDYDGDLDLFVANGHIQQGIRMRHDNVRYRQPAQLFLNHGDGTFAEARAAGSVLARPLVARGAAYGDYDRDGDPDLLITENGGPVHLWRNDVRGRYLRVQLEGRTSNRGGVGARLVAVAGGRRMERRIQTGGSYLSASEPVATFGLGGAGRVDSLLVFWPRGQVDRFAAVAANQTIRVREGDGRYEPRDAPAPVMTAQRQDDVR